MMGKFGISKTDENTVLSTRVHDQAESSLCWDYASTSSLRKSLKVKIGTDYKTISNFKFFVDLYARQRLATIIYTSEEASVRFYEKGEYASKS